MLRYFIRLLTNFTIANLVARIETLFLEGTFKAICSATVIYLSMEGASISVYNHIRELAERAVNASLTKITNYERKIKVLEVLPQVSELFFLEGL